MAIPAKLTIAEYWAAALAEAAAALDGADGVGKFLQAIETNHNLWLLLTSLSSRFPGKIDRRAVEFVMSMVYQAGRGIPDRHVEILIDINNGLSLSLLGREGLAAARRRAQSEWSRLAPGTSLLVWLMSEIDRINRTPEIPDGS